MKTVMIKQKKSNKFKHFYPLIRIDDLVNANDINEQGWISFYSESKEFLGYGYLGAQNKGAGWMISYDKATLPTVKYLTSLLNQAIESRRAYFNDDTTTAFRLFNGEGDGLGGVTIDWYDGYLVISWYNETIYAHQTEILNMIEASTLKVKGIYEKLRFNQNGGVDSRFVQGTKAPEPLIVKENNVNYSVYLDDGLMTGIFLDQREIRGRLMEYYSLNNTVLNTFSYTGAFSVAAAMGGATKTTSVDLAKRSLPKTKEQFDSNYIESSNHSIIVMDVFDYFKYAAKKEFTFDIVVMDPPSFARNKKKTFSVAKDYQKLTEQAVQLLNQDGILVASTNAANVTLEKFIAMVEGGIESTGRMFKQLEMYQLPGDFKISPYFEEGNYLKVLFYKVK